MSDNDTVPEFDASQGANEPTFGETTELEIYTIRVFNGFRFRFLYDNRQKSAPPILGIVIEDIWPSENMAYQEALKEATYALSALKRISNTGIEAISLFSQPSVIQAWDEQHVEGLIDAIEYALYRQTYWSINDVDTEFLVHIASLLQQEKQRRRQLPPPKNPGYVYLLQSPTSAYKIGRTRNPNDRMKTFGIQLPFEVEFICVIKAEDMIELERKLHDKFADKRVGGEWFRLTLEDVEYIKGLASP